MSREQKGQGVLHGRAEAEFERLRTAFEASEGAIVKAWWGVNKALGLALTVKAPRRIDKLQGNLESEATCRLHRATEGLEGLALPADVEAALFRGDLLAVKASGVLRGGAARLALERVMGAQTYLLSLTDASKDPLPSPVEPERGRRLLPGSPQQRGSGH